MPHISGLIRIADVYGVSLDYLAGRTDNEKGLYAEKQEKEVSERLSELEAAFILCVREVYYHRFKKVRGNCFGIFNLVKWVD